ncbi:MAG: hypothetical protein AMXMBFR77_01410 [Phycisphaerales bacterium]
MLDPFCGSGTLLVEASAMGRHSIGIDVDPLAVFVSRAKTTCWPPDALEQVAARLLRRLAPLRRSSNEYDRRMFQDVPKNRYSEVVANDNLWVPALADPFHWFRRYVLIDLARIRKAILAPATPPRYRDFFLLCFASIIRAASNADPVPVSGLEVTSHMRKKDAEGRRIDPFELFERAITKALRATSEFATTRVVGVTNEVRRGDSTNLSYSVRRSVDCLITSPPYHGAVDYYRRHMLEMYWLGMTRSQDDRLTLLPQYIGRARVPRVHPFLSVTPATKRVMAWEQRMRKVEPERADAFRHYTVAMQKFFDGAAKVLPEGRDAVLVVGRSTWNGLEIPTSQLFTELAHGQFKLVEHSWYPIKNRYMSYERRNGADINREHVLVYRRRK